MADAPAAPVDKVAQPDQLHPVSSTFGLPTGHAPTNAPQTSFGSKPVENQPLEQTRAPDLAKPEERPDKPAPVTTPFPAPNGEQKKDEPAAALLVMAGALQGEDKPTDSLKPIDSAPLRSDSGNSDRVIADSTSEKPKINSQAEETPKAPPPTPAVMNGNSVAKDTEMTGTQDTSVAPPTAPPPVSAPAPPSAPASVPESVPAPAVASAPSQPPVAAPAPAPVEEIAAPIAGEKRKVDEAVTAPAVAPATVSANGEPAAVQNVEPPADEAPAAKKLKTDAEPAPAATTEPVSQIESQPESQPGTEAAPTAGDDNTNGGGIKKSNSRAKKVKKIVQAAMGRTARKTRSQGPVEG